MLELNVDIKFMSVNDPEPNRIWYVLKDNTNYGPFSHREVMRMLQSKIIFEHDSIWREGQKGGWQLLPDVFEFSEQEIAKFYKENPGDDKVAPSQFYRRRYARIKVSASAIVHDNRKVYEAICMDISKGGARLMIEQCTFDEGQVLMVHFRPAKKFPAFNAKCKIVNRKGNQIGLKFVKVATAGVAQVKGAKAA